MRAIRPIRDPANRSPERLEYHYLVERELADRLRRADREERTRLYGEVYDELFRRVEDHPQLVLKADPALRAAWVRSEAAWLRRRLAPGLAFLEVGAGDCALSLEMCAFADRVYAIDVSAAIAESERTPPNFSLLITDGREIPVRGGSVGLAYSNQLMEHLHPDDAREQLENILSALAPGGAYVCLTPNRLGGPHDISAIFDDVPTGFHLHEYTTGELRALMRSVGFSRVSALARVRHHAIELPAAAVVGLERAIEPLAPAHRRRAARLPVVRNVIDAVVAYR